MPSWTVPEKEYWSQRLARKIDQKIENLAAAEPGLRERLASQARQRALRSLGLAELQADLEALTAQKQELQRRQRQAQRAMLAVVRRLPLEEIGDALDEDVVLEIHQAIDRRQAIHEEELLAAEERGQQLLQLRRERDNLQDTVWLAGSPASLQQLWLKVVELLGEEPTALQRQVLALAKEGASA